MFYVHLKRMCVHFCCVDSSINVCWSRYYRRFLLTLGLVVLSFTKSGLIDSLTISFTISIQSVFISTILGFCCYICIWNDSYIIKNAPFVTITNVYLFPFVSLITQIYLVIVYMVYLFLNFLFFFFEIKVNLQHCISRSKLIQ